MITAVKIIDSKEITHNFSQQNWDNLGKDKDGWVENTPTKPEAVAKAEQEAKANAEALAKADAKK